MPSLINNNYLPVFNTSLETHWYNVVEIIQLYYETKFKLEENHRNLIIYCLMKLNQSLINLFAHYKNENRNKLLTLIDEIFSEILAIEFDFVYEQDPDDEIYDDLDMYVINLTIGTDF